MPNWTTNILKIRGDQKRLEEFQEKNDGEKKEALSFEGLIPMPLGLDILSSSQPNEDLQKKYDENIKKYGFKCWYDWRRANWGTKWNADSSSVEDIEGGIQYRFITAWCAPLPWLQKAIESYPDLEFEMWSSYEGGEGNTVVTGSNGKISGEGEVSDHDWNMKFYEEYRDTFEFITEGDYDEVIKTYSKEDELEYYSLEEYLLARIKDKDLPLFVNFEWRVADYKARLKGE